MNNVLKRRQILLSAAALGGTLLLQGCGGGGDGTRLDDRKNLVDLASSKPELSTFVEAVNAAGLNDQLSSAGTNTVFAPNNDAFTALYAELGTTKAALFANTALLADVLKYHVLTKIVFKEAIPKGEAIGTLEGGIFKVEDAGSGMQITDGRNRLTNIVSTDSVALNGVLHVVDRVLLPANKDIIQTAQSNPDLATFAAAVEAAGLTDSLKAAGPFTVFAPTNAAFAALLTELGVTQAALLADKAMLTKVLTYHVLTTRYLKKELPKDKPLTTLQGGSFQINASLQITDQRGRISNVSTGDVFATNGMIQIVDKVLLPT